MHRPSTRRVLGGVEIEGSFKVVQTKHLLVQRVQLDAAFKVWQSQLGGGLKNMI